MDYHARFYSPSTGRFIQPDSIIPDMTNSQGWNRYAYVLNSPVMYTDPTGHLYSSTQNVLLTDSGGTDLSKYCDICRPGNNGYDSIDQDLNNSPSPLPPISNPPLNMNDDSWDEYQRYSEFATSSNPFPDVTQLPDNYQGTWALVYTGGWEPWAALGIDILSLAADISSVALLAGAITAEASYAVQVGSSYGELAWLEYRRESGHYEDGWLAYSQEVSDQASAIPYTGFFSSIGGIFIDIAEIVTSYEVLNYDQAE